jgi:hypothetical protein
MMIVARLELVPWPVAQMFLPQGVLRSLRLGGLSAAEDTLVLQAGDMRAA